MTLSIIAVGVALVVALTYTISTGTASTAPVPTGSGSKDGPQHLTFADEFDGNRLDTGQWQPNWLGATDSEITHDVAGSYELSCFDPAQVAVGGGSLTFTVVNRSCTTGSGVTYPYDSGLVNTLDHYTFTYGYAEARMWVSTATCGPGDIPKAPATCLADFPTFWATEPDTSALKPEVDMMEGLQGLACFHFHDEAPSVTDPDIGRCPTMRHPAGWHVYAVDWEPGRITFFYDGKDVGTIANPLIPDKPMYLILSLGVPAEWTDQTPAVLKVDYVRVWQHR
jgi:beta-glucanase (GH16 family)